MTKSRLLYALTCAFSLLLLAWCYYPTAIPLYERWNQPNEPYSHGLVVLGVCLALAARQWQALAAIPKAPWWPAIIPLLALTLLWLSARIANVQVVQQLTLPAIAFFTLMGLLGRATARQLRFPFAVFYAVVPVWDALNPLLQLLTVKVCTIGLKLLGIPAYIESTQISIPAGTLHVAGGCSGLNYLLMMGFVSAVYAHLYYRTMRHKILLMLIAVAFGLLCNWIRVFCLVIIGHVTQMQSPLMNEHEVMGWIIFAICLVPFLYIALRIEVRSSARDSTAARDGAPAAQRLERPWLPAIAAGAVAVIGPIWYLAVSTTAASDSLALALARQQPALTAAVPSTSWQPAFVKADEYTVFKDIRTTPATELHVVTYLSQEQGKELVQWGNRIADEGSWKLASDRTIADTSGTDYRLAVIQGAGRQAEVLYWYAVGERFTASDSWAKIYQVAAFLHGRQDASLMAIFYPCPTADCEPARMQAMAAAVSIKEDYRKATRQATR